MKLSRAVLCNSTFCEDRNGLWLNCPYSSHKPQWALQSDQLDWRAEFYMEFNFIFIYIFILTQGYVYWFQRERKGEREILCERENCISCHPEEDQTSNLCMRPNQGSNPQPRYVPWPGIEPATFWCMGRCSNQLNHLARALAFNFN